MYAIIATGGKQYKVAEGDIIDVELLPVEIGDTVDFDVIFLADGDKIITDADKLAKVSCAGEVIEQFKGDKQLIFKFKKRKRYKVLRGHRQNLMKVQITSLAATAARATKAVAEKKSPVETTVVTPAIEDAAPAPKTTTAKSTATKAAAATDATEKAPAAKKAPAARKTSATKEKPASEEAAVKATPTKTTKTSAKKTAAPADEASAE
jgi:large subunit ribosomal protein L21